MDLPVYEIEQELLKGLSKKQGVRILLRAPTGSGKSTAVPQMMLDSGLVEGLIVVVQPRRIAARMLARRVAGMRGGSVGCEVGHVVRFDRQMGKSTRIVYVTDGVLAAWLEADDEMMARVGAVVFDEFHERRLASDMSLALCLEGQGQRKIVVMSATLEMGALAEYLGDECVELEARGRSYPVEISYRGALIQSRGRKQEEAIWEKCVQAVRAEIEAGCAGHVLVFLPGVYEIRRCCEMLEQAGWSRGWDICPLYSALAPELQDRAVYGGGDGGMRVVVATNVAETSLTIDGVRCVVDAGVARISNFDPVRGVDTLMLEKISRAAAEQRSGRAGRTGPGRCVRLWSEADHGRRAAFELAEVQRVDMTETVLQLKLRGCIEVRDFDWFEQPSAPLLEHAEGLLRELGAVDEQGMVSGVGRRMSGLRMHPRFARLLLAADAEGCLGECVFIAAVVQGEGIFVRGGDGKKGYLYEDDGSDFAGEWRAFSAAVQARFDPRRCQQYGVMGRGARDVDQVMKQIYQQCKRTGMTVGEVDFSKNKEAVVRAMLVAFSDQVGLRIGQGNLSCRLVGGRSGKLDDASVVKDSEAFLVTELTEVGGRNVQLYLDRCVGLDLAQLKAAFPKEFNEGASAVYDETIRRVVRRQESRFRDLVLSSKDGGEPDAGEAAQLLAEQVANGSLKLKKWDSGVEQWIARLLSLGQWMPELELPGFDEEDRAIAFEQICEGALGYKDIKDRAVMPALNGWLSAGQKASLDHYAPPRIKLSNGREVRLRYEVGQPPTMALQVQRLFGVSETPTIADGKVKVLVHVCAPNQRPWQMTQDLPGFWKSGFAQMKKDLAGRYPKHKWEIDS